MMEMTEPIAVDVGTRFEEFFHQHHERLLRGMYLATGNRHEAEDLAQEAFVRVLERWDRVAGTANPLGYLFRTALNLRRSRLRRLRTASRRLIALAQREHEDPISATDDRDVVRRALATLPDGQREALVLCEWLDMTDAEAAKVLGTTPGAIRVRCTRARHALRAQLRGDDDERPA
jgi:RNA polymerase sigma-70 factor, ECF subfamily